MTALTCRQDILKLSGLVKKMTNASATPTTKTKAHNSNPCPKSSLKSEKKHPNQNQ